ncbi:MAG: hypothetical protein ACE5IZ_03490 [Dehalococcoidia bacterium]
MAAAHHHQRRRPDAAAQGSDGQGQDESRPGAHYKADDQGAGIAHGSWEGREESLGDIEAEEEAHQEEEQGQHRRNTSSGQWVGVA